jgi:CMP-2-keto-3-deoxyoctulosonic acid synthetase
MTAEDLEQLAWLEHGFAVQVIEVESPVFAIDTPDQLAAARTRLYEEPHA